MKNAEKQIGKKKRQSGDRLHQDHTGLFPPWEFKCLVKTIFAIRRDGMRQEGKNTYKSITTLLPVILPSW